jgi:NADP-dependent 3-hydroxy acid dehydrogenase YdfG
MFNGETEVVFLTGASRGIGRAIATSLARNGVERMCLLARSLKDLQETARYNAVCNAHSE